MKVLFRSYKVNLPDFLIIGVMRGGTTSLYEYLSSHPEIFMPTLKEPHFFSYFGTPVSPHPSEIKKTPWTIEEYIELFKSVRPNQIIGEASISYIYMYPRTIENIRRIYEDRYEELKIIGVLRNPIDRAWSIYSLKKQGGDWKDDFLSYARQFEAEGNKFQYYNFLASGLYSQQVKAYLDIFPLTKFILFDDLVNAPERAVKECLEFLGTKDLSISQKVGTVYNYSGVPRNRFTEPLYRLLFSRYFIKNYLKNFIPENIRIEVKRWLGSLLSRKDALPPEIREYLGEKFKDDLLELADLFDDEYQKDIIKGWIT